MNFMKRCLKGLYMSLGMFSIIPLPFQLKDDCGKDLMLPCLPLIGGIAGFLWWGLATLIVSGGIPVVLVAAAVALFPFFITGFFHLDGYMDTSDAILSRRDLEERRRILKDPHAGAFGVIMLVSLFVLQFAASYAAVYEGRPITMLAFIPIISRCCSAMSVLCLEPMPQSSYANMFKQNAAMPHKAFTIFLLIIAIALSWLFAGIGGLIVTASVIAGFMAAMAYAYNDLKGISGDLAGFALVISELCGLVALAVI